MLTGNFVWFIIILILSHMIVFYYGDKQTQNFILGCQYVLLWLKLEVNVFNSFTYWYLIVILKQPL